MEGERRKDRRTTVGGARVCSAGSPGFHLPRRPWPPALPAPPRPSPPAPHPPPSHSQLLTCPRLLGDYSLSSLPCILFLLFLQAEKQKIHPDEEEAARPLAPLRPRLCSL